MNKTILIFLLAIFFVSCTMEKRVYRPGWYLQKNTKTESIKTKSEKQIYQKQIETIIQKPPANDSSRVEIIKTETANIFHPHIAKSFSVINEPDSIAEEEKIKKTKKRLKPLSIKTVDVRDNTTVGIARSVIAIIGFGFIIWFCFLGLPFIWFAIPLAFFVTLCALSGVFRLAEMSSWNSDSSFTEKISSVFLGSSLVISLLLFPFSFLVIIGLSIYVRIADAIYLKKKRREKKDKPVQPE